MKYIIRCYLDNTVLLSHYDNFPFGPINIVNNFLLFFTTISKFFSRFINRIVIS